MPAAVGILMLDTRFPRPLGDIGNPGTWAFPVHMRRVTGASAERVVAGDPSRLLQSFIEAGQALIREGCAGLTTSCGFLSLLQDELKEALGVPFASSSLMQLPQIEACLPAHQRAGVVTICERSLTPAHLSAAGARPDTDLQGLPRDGAFASAIFEDRSEMDLAACRAEMREAGRALIARDARIGAIVLECTNMAPYAADIAEATGRPVYSIVSFLNWFHAGLQPPKTFPA